MLVEFLFLQISNFTIINSPRPYGSLPRRRSGADGWCRYLVAETRFVMPEQIRVAGRVEERLYRAAP